MAEQDKLVAKVIKHPGIPVIIKPQISWLTVLMWVLACFLVFLGPFLLARDFLYSFTRIPLGGQLHDLAVDLEGCDVLFERSRHAELRLGFWRLMGSGSVEHSGNLVKVQAAMTRKALAFHCLFIVTVPHGSSGPHFRSVNLTVEPSANALTAPRPSNVAETISVHVSRLRVQHALRINVSTIAETMVEDTSAENMQLHVRGGSLTVSSTEGSDAEVGRMNITAENTMVSVQMENRDISLTLDNETMAGTTLAAASLWSGGRDDGGVERYHLSKGGTSGTKPLDLVINATNSAVYALAAGRQALGSRSAGTCPQLDIRRGALAEGQPMVTREGREELETLAKWLKNPANNIEFVVYLHIPFPQDRFAGVLKLVSTEIYTKLSPIGFALLSGGAMEPYVIRITMPIFGMDWAFPDRPCDSNGTGLGSLEALRFGKETLSAVDSVLETHSLGLQYAKWVWEAPHEPRYIFDYVTKNNGRTPRWRPRVLGAGDLTFQLGAGITMLVGIVAGIVICKILYWILRPEILDTIRKADIFSTASYRLQHTSEPILWVVTATLVQWPMHGALLRWKQRPMSPQFASLTFVARPWPVSDSETSEVRCPGIDPTRLPTYPSLPDQECFLFAVEPGDSKEATPYFPEAFNTELYAMGMLQYGRPTPQPALTIGRPYQFQVVAHNAAGKVVEKSQWSRPTVVQPSRAFTDYPMLLWRGCCGIIPNNTFEIFIGEHCQSIEPSPSLSLTLSKIKLVVDSDSTLFWGEDIGVYGAEVVEALAGTAPQQVSIAISAGGILPLYETTRMVPLPTRLQRGDASKGLIKTFDQALPGTAKGSAPGLEQAHLLVLDFPGDVITVPVGYDLSCTFIRVEASVTTASGVKENTAKVDMNWQQILSAATRSPLQLDIPAPVPGKKKGKKGQAEVAPPQPMSKVDITLRDGLTPVAMLSFQCNFSNTILPTLNPPVKPSVPSTPEIFKSVVPGSTYVWGETITLAWEGSRADKRSGAGVMFDLVLVSEGFHWANRGEAFVQTETVVATAVNVYAEKAAIVLAPNQSVTCQAMRCHLEARPCNKGAAAPQSSSQSKAPVLTGSWEFVITRPVTMQQLELAYAAYCICNKIPMQPVPQSAMEALFIETAERRLNYCTGYRAVLPTPSETPKTFDPTQGPVVVENSSSIVITGADGLTVESPNGRPANGAASGGVAPAAASSPTKGSAASRAEATTPPGRPATATAEATPPPSASAGSTAAQPSGRSSTGGGLAEPLLMEAGKAPSEPTPSKGGSQSKPAAAAKPVTVKDILPKQDALVITTNVFWKWHVSHAPSLLLTYWFLPSFAEPAALGKRLLHWGWIKAAKIVTRFNPLDDAMRFILGTILFYGQMSIMGFPGLLLFIIWLWHDTVLSRMWPDLMPIGDAHQIFLVDFLVAPNWSRWNHLPVYAQMVYAVLILYISIVVITAFFCNFFRGVKGGSKLLITKLANQVVSTMWAFTFFFSIVLITVVLVWIVMGALVNPAKLLPYAIMLVAFFALYRTLSDKLSQMKSSSSTGTHSMLDHMSCAIFQLFVEDPDASAKIDASIKATKTLAKSVTENMIQQEKDIRNILLKQSKITPVVGDVLRTQMDELRASPYYTTVEGQGKNQVLLTDFIPGPARDDLVKSAQAHAITSANIAGTNMLGTTQSTVAKTETGEEVTTTCAAAAPPITPEALGRAIAESDKVQIEKPGQLDSSWGSWIGKLSSQLSLRPGTTRAAVSAYLLQLQMKRSESNPPTLSNAYSCACLFTRIRRDRLFSHFVEREVEGPDGGKTIECNVRKMLGELQNVELESLRCKAATALSKQLDWTRISREGEAYVMTTLEGTIIDRVTDEQLNPVINGSAAFDLTMKVYELAFSKYDAVYKSDPLQIFVDCGIIELRYKRLPATQRVLTDVVDGQRAFDNSLCQDNLINCVKALCIPAFQPAGVNDVPARSFLWFGALVRILKRLGWTQEEMANEWLSRRWRAVTNGTGIFGYEGLSEVNDLIMSLSGDGLWKAAAKGLMLTVGVGGYVGHDVKRDGGDKAAKGAHHLKEDIDQMDLEAVANAAGEWPDYMEDIWSRNAKRPGSLDPDFLPTTKILDFLQDLVYLPDPPAGVTFAQLSPYATDILDLDWFMGSDNSVWQKSGATKKRLRGFWLELSLILFTELDSVPTDLDIFYKALAFQLEQRHSQGTAFLRLDLFRAWLQAEYFKSQTWCTFRQFKPIVVTMLGCDIPEGPLKTQVFDPCPKDPEDDLGELRRLSDLGAALQIWLGYGLWPSAVGQAVEELLPRGRVQTVAMSMLPSEFAKLDPEGLGVLQPADALVLTHRLLVPGLTCEDMVSFINDSLGVTVPEREVHKYFTMMDVNGDGVLQAEEFIPMFFYLVFDFFPHYVMRRLNLTTFQIVRFILGVLAFLAALFILVTLVIQAFPTGRSVAATIHSSVSGISAYAAKQSSDNSIGFEDTMTNLKRELEKRALDAIVAVLGVGKAVVERVLKLMGTP